MSSNIKTYWKIKGLNNR